MTERTRAPAKKWAGTNVPANGVGIAQHAAGVDSVEPRDERERAGVEVGAREQLACERRVVEDDAPAHVVGHVGRRVRDVQDDAHLRDPLRHPTPEEGSIAGPLRLVTEGGRL